MTLVTPPESEPPVTGLPTSEFRSLMDIQRSMQLGLSKSDKISYQKLVNILLEDLERSRGKEALELSIRRAFESPLYSDASKKYFAAKYIYSYYVLLGGDKFLTEEIILGFIEEANWRISEDYLPALAGSSHLSENIIAAVFRQSGPGFGRMMLKVTPDAMVTPGLISVWIAKYSTRQGFLGFTLSSAALQVKRAHPEYEGFPDDWVIKVFCGEYLS